MQLRCDTGSLQRSFRGNQEAAVDSRHGMQSSRDQSARLNGFWILNQSMAVQDRVRRKWSCVAVQQPLIFFSACPYWGRRDRCGQKPWTYISSSPTHDPTDDSHWKNQRLRGWCYSTIRAFNSARHLCRAKKDMGARIGLTYLKLRFVSHYDISRVSLSTRQIMSVREASYGLDYGVQINRQATEWPDWLAMTDGIMIRL